MKTLHGYELVDVNKEQGKVDYIAEENGEKKLLRVVVDKELKHSPGYVETINETLEELKEKDFDEATIFVKRMTSSSRRIVKENEILDYASSKNKPFYAPVDLLLAIQMKVQELCIERCGKIPRSQEDCPSSGEGETVCMVRKISDDADFHAQLQWMKLLIKDFSKLVELQEKEKKGNN
jgi:hypothetical protein